MTGSKVYHTIPLSITQFMKYVTSFAHLPCQLFLNAFVKAFLNFILSSEF